MKKRSIVFVSGVYGVGKSTLCCNLSNNDYLPFYSVGDLISRINGEKYGSNKKVKNKNTNQDILVDEVLNVSKDQDLIILVGHFCIMGQNDKPEELPSYNRIGLELTLNGKEHTKPNDIIKILT